MSAKARAFQQACRSRIGSPKNLLFNQQAVNRPYATHSSTSSGPKRSSCHRRAVTVTTDDGRYQWSELSTGEKAARSTQQSFNFLLVAAGAVGTVCVAYLLYQELFAADSKTRQFNYAVDRIKADPRCRDLLGPSRDIKAYGEPTSNKWARARPLAHSVEVDRFGTTHFRMHFNVEGSDGKGVVHVHMTKTPEESELKYHLLSLTVPGHETIYLEQADAKNARKALGRMFGVQWK